MRRTSGLVVGLTVLSVASGAVSQQAQTQAPARGGASGFTRPAVTDRCAPSQYAADTYFPAPAVVGQTKAPAAPSRQAFNIEVFASGVDHPWSLAFLPDGDMLVTLKAGGMRMIGKNGAVSAPIANTPQIVRAGLSGMHDLLLDKDFAKNRTLYFAYVTKAESGPGATGRIVRAQLSADGKSLENLTVIHEGGTPRRITHAPDGTLLITSGETGGPNPQDLGSENGKVLRINTDGSIPKDNPFLNTPGAKPALYAIGFRDPEGAQINPATGDLWTIENGPRGGDELNRVRKGANYGFSTISYGREYSGDLINEGKTAQAGMEQPIYFWTPSIAPSGLLFYTGKALPGWTGNVFVGAMAGKHLIRLEMKDGKVTAEEKMLTDRCRRIRDVRQGPDGLIYVLTDETDGEILRLTPKR